MKLRIKNQIATALTGILLLTAATSTAVHATEEKPLKTHQVLPFKKIVIKGNVEVVLLQKSGIGVSYADDNEGTAKVLQQGDVLTINGSGTTRAKLVVYVTDIYRIEADDNANVKTDGALTTKYLQIILKGNAHADIYTKSEELYTSIWDKSALCLKGNTGSHFLYMDKNPSLTFDQFAALRTQNGGNKEEAR